MNDKETEILEKYNRIKTDIEQWGSFVDEMLLKLLDEGYIKTDLLKIPPKYRLKDDKSYLFKALYRKKEYINPIKQIEDKVGTRLVFLKSDDLKKVQEIILNSKIWNAKTTKSIENEIEDKPNIFDYQSVHVVVWPTEDYDTELDRSLLTCEIQIRTLLQHAFAEVSHDSAYKGPYKNDSEILRHLAKSMALMEATDDYFCNIFSLMSDEKRRYKSYLSELVRIFKEFNEEFKPSGISIDISDGIFELLEKQDVSINDLEAFVEKKRSEIEKACNPKHGSIFGQPAILLVIYYLYNHQLFLKENWPLNLDFLKQVYTIMNFSYDSY